METLARRTADLEAGLDELRAAPRGEGTVELIVRRPEIEQREVLDEGELSLEEGLVGDVWRRRGKRPNPKAQVTLINARCIQLVAGSKERWPLAGDQLYVDFDLGDEHLPAGTRLALGDAVLEVTDLPHLGCSKFAKRYGPVARDFVNSPEGVELNLRGINTRVVEPGTVRVGDAIRKL
jgi:MOSC domain-containing protein YiiM